MPYTATYLWFVGICSIATAWLFISAIRLCRQVEDRSERLRNFSSVARRPKLVNVAINRDVASDVETQALRRGMIARLLAIGALGIAVNLIAWTGV
ncbi:MAG: hypothetical protein EOR84_28420 [Mesorhizobium sp.]|uniref:hypothetical protein n=1 Tax=Mesorhizobium sp. TaxID=1871066 RepID=UPI000FE50534|nr:hypothetical protein [Mesorhizobium sp.]RWM88347.1 MAG: hypothetical protein EOR84_28420 [Mesorhizobium sp.]